MAYWSQSAFLQALGWATLNSFWQFALLWILFTGFQFFFKLSPSQKYNLALGGLSLGAFWFVATFFFYIQTGSASFTPTGSQLAPTSNTWQLLLSSASLTYLILLVIPAYRLFKNWQYITAIKSQGLEKPAAHYRLFVNGIANRLGIKKKVHLYISHLVTSPVTIGYVKPVILLPIAALTSLNTQQVEAVLLHELSHIRRYDYLINLIVTILHTVLYYNPFVKKFISALEAEREKCCDELVLQFEYDKLDYATALLTLEKSAASSQVLAIGAAGKKHLLTRIEKIVGQEKTTPFRFTHFAGLMSTFLLILALNSLLFVNHQPPANAKTASLGAEGLFIDFSGTENLFTRVRTKAADNVPEQELPLPSDMTASVNMGQTHTGSNEHSFKLIAPQQPEEMYPAESMAPFFVSYNEATALIGAEEKEQIATTVEATKKVLRNAQWKEVEKSIADGMTPEEKVLAHQEYLQELEKVNWQKLESKLKQDYTNLDWNRINSELGQALITMQLDSLQQSYTKVLRFIQQAESNAAVNGSKPSVLPIPDASVMDIKLIKEGLQVRIDSIKVVKTRKIIDL